MELKGLIPGQTGSQVEASPRNFHFDSHSTVFRLTTHLRGLALTLVKLKFVRKSTQVFHRLATQQVDRKSTVYA